MLSEEFDKKIREAADRHHPQYDERAWREMKKLLDEHMPVKEDKKRRGLFFLLFLLLLGGAAAVFFLGYSGGRKQELTETIRPVSTPSSSLPAVKEPSSGSGSSGERPVEQPLSNNVSDADILQTQSVSGKSGELPEPVNKDSYTVSSSGSIKQGSDQVTNRKAPVPAVKQNKNTLIQNQVAAPIIDITTIPAGKKKSNSSDNKQASIPMEGNKNLPHDPVSTPSVTNVTTPAAVSAAPGNDKAAENQNQVTPVNNPATVNTTTKSPATPPVTAKKEAKANPTKQVAKKKSSFFFSATAAPDVSFTSGDELGRLKLTGGIGMGYTYRGRVSLRTGFYSGRKIYTASPDNYKRNAWFNQYYPNLQKVEADCKVQEIPIMLSYHFGQKGHHQWFASAGVSTLIMKEETYDYYYKYTPQGQVVNRSYTTYNQNKHPFSIMTLSAGYQYKMSNRFSVIAEPYLKLPLSGVGNGKVKLNSMGVMFSVTATPFGK